MIPGRFGEAKVSNPAPCKLCSSVEKDTLNVPTMRLDPQNLKALIGSIPVIFADNSAVASALLPKGSSATYRHDMTYYSGSVLEIPPSTVSSLLCMVCTAPETWLNSFHVYYPVRVVDPNSRPALL